MQRQQLLNILTIFFAVLFILGLYITFESGVGWTLIASDYIGALITGSLLTVFSGIALLIRWKSFLDEK